MNKKLIGKLIVSMVILILILIKIGYSSSIDVNTEIKKVEIPNFSHEHFEKSMERANLISVIGIEGIKGGITPHHLLADGMMGSFYKTLKDSTSEISTVIVIGPDHFQSDGEPVKSFDLAWETPIGVLYPSINKIEELSNSLSFMEIGTEDVFVNEHTITAQVPYIKYAFPKAEIIPIIIDYKLESHELNQLIEQVEKIIDEDTIILCSMDFSHYLIQSISDEKDIESLNAIRNFDYNTIAGFNDDNLDSPNSAILFLKLMESLESKNIYVLESSSATKIMKKDTADNTTYFTILFSE